jgi:hypothetical protein
MAGYYRQVVSDCDRPLVNALKEPSSGAPINMEEFETSLKELIGKIIEEIKSWGANQTPPLPPTPSKTSKVPMTKFLGWLIEKFKSGTK